jgi:hypothetical protein
MARKPRSKTGKAKATKATRESASVIAERSMPGWKAVAPSGPVHSFGVEAEAGVDAALAPKVDAVMPSMAELHRKYYGESADAPADTLPDKPLADGLEVVEMKSGDLRKSVGVNRRSKKVEWSQG